MPKHLIALLIVLASTSTATAGTILMSPAEFEAAKATPAQWVYLQKECDDEINATPRPFISLDSTDRYLTGGKNTLATEVMDSDLRHIYRSALCYKFSGQTKYAADAQKYLDAWQKTFRRVNGASAQNAIGFYMPYAIVGAEWVKGVNGWDGVNFGEFLKTRIRPASRSYYKDNISDWGLVLNIAIASYLKDRKALDEASTEWQTKVNTQIAQERTASPDSDDTGRYLYVNEICRSDDNGYCSATRTVDGVVVASKKRGLSGIGYTHFATIALTTAAELLLKNGINVYETTAGSVKFKEAYRTTMALVNEPSQSPYYGWLKGYFPLFLTSGCTEIKDSNGTLTYPCSFKAVGNFSHFSVLKKRFPTATAIYPVERFAGDGSNKDFTYSFSSPSSTAGIRVTLRDITADTKTVLSSGYSVNLTTKTVTYPTSGSAINSDKRLIVERIQTPPTASEILASSINLGSPWFWDLLHNNKYKKISDTGDDFSGNDE